MRLVRRPFVVPLLAGAILLAGAVRLFAEDLDVPKLFDQAKASFGEKRYGKCWSDLQLVVAEVARLRMDSLKAALPAAPAGWTAEEAEGQSAGGWAWLSVGTQVKRTYRKGEETNAEIGIHADSPMMAMLMMKFQFVQGNTKNVTIKGRRALLEYDKEDKRGTLTVVLNVPNAYLEIQGNAVASGDLSDALPAALDLDAIEKAIAN